MVEYKKIHVSYPPASKKLKGIMANYMLKAQLVSKIPWKHMAWATAGFPIELLWTYDVYPLHPENAACVAGVRKISQEMIEYAEGIGLSRDLCSYMKTNIGAYDKKLKIDQGGISKPSFCCSTNTICDTHVKWFQLQARRMGIPYFGLDIPSFVAGSDQTRMEEYVDYVVDQLNNFFDFMYDQTGKKFNEQKFRTILDKSEQLAAAWHEIYEYRKKIPTPYAFQDTLSSIFPLVLLPGLDTGVKFYKEILAELKDIVAAGKGSLPPGEEKYRLIFEGIPMWYKIKFLYELANYGAVVVYEPYTLSFGPRKKLGLPRDKMIRELAKILIHVPYTYNLEARIQYFEKTIDDYKIDGVILHENMSCRPSCAGMIDLKNAIQKDKGIPVWLMSCDMNDPRAYTEAAMKTRMEGFIELMEANKRK